ncbi:MAG: AI-2E family transporter [Planctomycetota bacterium]
MPKGRPTSDGPSEEELRRQITEHQLRYWELFEWGRQKVTKALMWGAVFLIFYLFRAFFPLLFLTFVFSFITQSLCKLLGRYFPQIPWKARVIAVFMLFFVLMTIMIALLVPRVTAGYYEVKDTIREFPTIWKDKVDPWLYEKFPPYKQLVTESKVVTLDVEMTDVTGEVLLDEKRQPRTEKRSVTQRERNHLFQVRKVRELLADLEGGATVKKLPGWITDVVSSLMAVLTLLFLATLFSFLIVFDLDNLRRELRKLESTRLDNVYAEVGRDLVKFGSVLGKVLEAQAVIAMVNSLLTALGLWILGVPNVGILSLIVFVCGFIPVAGVFISSGPICLVGLYSHGLPMLGILVAFITAIHFLEAYVLNPRIMGAALRINPVLVLIILVIGHHALGVWGLLLGLPICYYFFTHVIKREEREIGLRVKFNRSPATGSR